jgi:hypothetical protein
LFKESEERLKLKLIHRAHAEVRRRDSALRAGVAWNVGGKAKRAHAGRMTRDT